ncbi:hypothetical protein HHK36_008745 [Tetracentron sinense]|uniref:Brix domain-containing protein n=1 Tax=Tetracentron sinense TaxID=13715 RepID=A0A834ZG26_TETSI|nr:hypothetical protein HHK36_008745 [Tetracentron sinense]
MQLFAGNDADEFSSILKLECTPKILITTCRFHSSRGPDFIKELLSVIPNAHYYKRGTYDLKKIVEYAKNKDFTSVIVVHTNRREPNALLIMGLPDGPTANFKLSRLVLRKDIKSGEVNIGNRLLLERDILKVFWIELAHFGRVSKPLECLLCFFPLDKCLKTNVSSNMQECGPRFTLKLISLQHGTFDTKGGEFEWVHKPEMDTSRRRFFL